MRRTVQWCGVLLLVAAGGAEPAPAASRGDLRVAALTVTPATVVAGQAVTVRERTTNGGRARARASVTRYWLSADRRRGRGDVRLGERRVKALARRRSATTRRTLVVPRSVTPGAWHVVACADARARLREASERNNCRATRTPLTVLAAASPGAPAAPAAPAAPGPGLPPPGAGGGATPPAQPAGFPRPADPLDVTPVLDAGAAAQRLVTADGGQVTAAADDGTTYTLTVPAGALLADTPLRMTPVTSLDGAPGRLVGAVRLEPEGLTLAAPATLTIAPAGDPPPVSAQHPVMAQGDGRSLRAHPPLPGAPLQVPVGHFSIAGVLEGDGAVGATLAQRTPVGSRAQYEQAVADRVRLAHERLAQGIEDDGWPADLQPLHLAYYRDVVAPLMERALTDEGSVDAAIAEGLYWLRSISLLGDEDDPGYGPAKDEVHRRFEAILRASLDRNLRACVEDSELRAIRRILQVARAASLLGFDLGTGLDAAATCLRFELRLESRMHLGGVLHHLRSEPVLLEPVLEDRTVRSGGAVGDGPLRWATPFSVTSSGAYECPAGEVTSWVNEGYGSRDSTLRAGLSLDLGPRPAGVEPAQDTFGAVLALDTGGAVELYRQTRTGGCPGVDTWESSNWENFWAQTIPLTGHPDYEVFKQGAEGATNTPLTVFTKVRRGGDAGQLLSVALDVDTPTLDEELAVDVFHRPLG